MSLKSLLILCALGSQVVAFGCDKIDSEKKNDAVTSNAVIASQQDGIVQLKQATSDLDIAKDGLKVTLRATRVNERESFLVNVYEVGETDSSQLSSFSFFPSPATGEIRSFIIAVPPSLNTQPTQLRFELVSVDPAHILEGTELEILSTKVVSGSTN